MVCLPRVHFESIGYLAKPVLRPRRLRSLPSSAIEDASITRYHTQYGHPAAVVVSPPLLLLSPMSMCVLCCSARIFHSRSKRPLSRHYPPSVRTIAAKNIDHYGMIHTEAQIFYYAAITLIMMLGSGRDCKDRASQYVAAASQIT